MKISEILSNETIMTRIEIEDKDSLLNKMCEMINQTGKIKDIKTAQKEIFNREGIMSTGVGKGIALPHAKTQTVDESIGALVTLKSPIDYQSLDGNPVNIVFMLLGTESNVGQHLKLLSQISRIMNNDSFRNEILESQNGNEILDIISKFESI
jgi:fructose-specific phosphotransferase system IIA component